MLRLEQKELAEQAGISVETIKRIEGELGPVPTHASTMASIKRALESAGVEFTNGGQPGVRLRREFISEDETQTFEGWLRLQAIDPAAMSPELLERARADFDASKKASSTLPALGRIKLPSGRNYAVAVRDGGTLWLTLFVRRSPKGEYFVMLPRRDRKADIHASYHLDGARHVKSDGRKMVAMKGQPLMGTFRGVENLVAFMGHGPKHVGAICHPEDFAGVVDVAPGVLGPWQGSLIVDLVARVIQNEG